MIKCTTLTPIVSGSKTHCLVCNTKLLAYLPELFPYVLAPIVRSDPLHIRYQYAIRKDTLKPVRNGLCADGM